MILPTVIFHQEIDARVLLINIQQHLLILPHFHAFPDGHIERKRKLCVDRTIDSELGRWSKSESDCSITITVVIVVFAESASMPQVRGWIVRAIFFFLSQMLI